MMRMFKFIIQLWFKCGYIEDRAPGRHANTLHEDMDDKDTTGQRLFTLL